MRDFPKLAHKEFSVFKKLGTPAKIQDFVDGMPVNFQTKGLTCRSPLGVLRRNEAHCMEGAMLAAAALWHGGRAPLLLDLRTTDKDFDHVVALFRQGGKWGAISKTNHAVLRYRDPVYKTTRELAMSYFNEYFMPSTGIKTLRSFSAPFNLLRYGEAWLTSEKHLWDVPVDLDDSRHFNILKNGESRNLRLADRIERNAARMEQRSRKP